MDHVLDIERFITQSLSPAFVLSAIALLAGGLHTRLLAMTGRIRALNKEARDASADVDADVHRYENIGIQVDLLTKRIGLIRNALFLLYGAMGCMVVTAIAIALHELFNFFPQMMLPVWLFLGGLVLMFGAVVIEAFGVMIILKTVDLDTFSSYKQRYEEP